MTWAAFWRPTSTRRSSSPIRSLVWTRNGVGRLIRFAVAEGKRTRPDIKLGICGEHGGDLSSVEFCHNVGLNYVSCSPFRVPIARLAAAHGSRKGAWTGINLPQT
ncbi:MAG: putative PEP-binding protein [Butyricicoccaceae bacterium]